MTLTEQLIATIRDVPDFPKQGILFKDITPVLADPKLSERVSHAFLAYWRNKDIDGIVGIESRGFIFGMKLAQELQVPFIPVRKAGKLPFQTIKHSYDLEYGSAEMEIHIDAIKPGQNILIHDDLLATGGTALAAAELIKKCEGNVGGYSFMVELEFLKGRESLCADKKIDIQTLVGF
ncbi:adenine phosphoribosyltransferase [Reichenbachiella versicolor]|uniref:adenine phosphoribosyltransferase n=1 Tax=Reichenbachiella versicolor TaxID=1821036 RepID=UPI000D6E3B1C|nr:adenine phosphoribosyltransferase [Reichenbachiella versicolor]